MGQASGDTDYCNSTLLEYLRDSEIAIVYFAGCMFVASGSRSPDCMAVYEWMFQAMTYWSPTW